MRARFATTFSKAALTLLTVFASARLPVESKALQRVYECRDGATRVLSDRPCGTESSLRALDPRDLNRYTPVPLPRASPSPIAPARPMAPRRASTPRQRDCRDLQLKIDRIDSRMRLGYTAKVGERLRVQRRQLTGQYADHRCNTTSRRTQN